MLLLIDKPAGITSFDVIRKLRTRYGRVKMGHAGTLDPFATGLMLVAVGETKKLRELLKLPKTYEAEVLLGVRTATGDPYGALLEERPVAGIDPDMVRRAVAGLRGKLVLPVPRYAAVKVKGERLYKRARRGEEFEPPEREMEVRAAECHGIRKEGSHLVVAAMFEVASGTYIRSLAEELGRRLGYPASLKTLRRTRIGAFRVEDAEKLAGM